jgi:hypothetical protein
MHVVNQAFISSNALSGMLNPWDVHPAILSLSGNRRQQWQEEPPAHLLQMRGFPCWESRAGFPPTMHPSSHYFRHVRHTI